MSNIGKLSKRFEKAIDDNWESIKFAMLLIFMTIFFAVIAIIVNAQGKNEDFESKNEKRKEKPVICKNIDTSKETDEVQQVNAQVTKEITAADNRTIEPFAISGLPADCINDKLIGGYLENMGQTLYEVEQTYKVNFRFIYAIGALESGYGKYLPAKHNYFGLTKGGQNIGYQSFESKEEVIKYMGRLLSSNTYKDKSIEDIAMIYCPPNHISWAKDIKWIMEEI